MNDEIVFIVGDRLAGGPPRRGIMSLSRLVADLRAGLLRDPLPALVPGQGIERHEMDLIRAELKRCRLPGTALWDAVPPELAGRGEVHKHRQENVLIAGLRRIGDTHYQAALRLSNTHEMVLDHTTGTHVTGMVVTEAVRQMSLAVAERYLLKPGQPVPRFLINSLQVSFSRFLLPLDAEIDYHLDEAVWKRPDVLRYHGQCDVLQAGVTTASGSMSLSVHEEGAAERIEETQSDAVVQRLADRHQAGRSPEPSEHRVP
ncbi:AfsA-related hotdog domain-containing protein [Streptomyces botrytidirepellens]|uniref:A-factor biosynthesis protein AfsA n=1 Tax=Streptomyces botrytidirepellens TaxID=2486417 RepID=A0A3M8WXL2_9ACTN|nr:AfsA-related hotdog domain-containing protein [Streptomyces botrytidirepellens]RNG34932.1 A-factor biosynthesis protein AfsA [Streptomyces botrytidirepellens]